MICIMNFINTLFSCIRSAHIYTTSCSYMYPPSSPLVDPSYTTVTINWGGGADPVCLGWHCLFNILILYLFIFILYFIFVLYTLCNSMQYIITFFIYHLFTFSFSISKQCRLPYKTFFYINLLLVWFSFY